ncbi:hypothetical protein LTR94_028424 [Friedmanniomyces endolithicus]|nr:hypothetical protein LTR94_028424 [Friedmanniomyces endolithicus]
MFQAREPQELLIDEVEALWRPIEADDDWGPLNTKLEKIEQARDAWRFDQPDSSGEALDVDGLGSDVPA